MSPSPTPPPDARALLRLLWLPNHSASRSGLSLPALVDAAVRLADADGLAALTMRRLATELGVGAMTLYGYVPGRAELLELMVDRVATCTYRDAALPVDLSGWSRGLRHVAEQRFDEAVRHQWLTELPLGRPVLGPGVCCRYELELSTVEGLGLTDVEMDDLLSAVTGLSLHCARWQACLDRERAAASDDQWWGSMEPELAAAMGAMDLPISNRVGKSVASAGEPRRTLDTGLTFLLNGVAVALDARAEVSGHA